MSDLARQLFGDDVPAKRLALIVDLDDTVCTSFACPLRAALDVLLRVHRQRVEVHYVTARGDISRAGTDEFIAEYKLPGYRNVHYCPKWQGTKRHKAEAHARLAREYQVIASIGDLDEEEGEAARGRRNVRAGEPQRSRAGVGRGRGADRSRARVPTRGRIVSAPPPQVSPAQRLLRRVRRVLVLLGFTYLGLIVVFLFLERRLVFQPSSAEDAWLKPDDPRSEDVSFPSADGNTISARWIPPETPHHGAVLLAHGNGGNLTHRGKVAAQLRQTLGAGVLLFDYPGYGKSTGTPTETGCYASADAAYQWLVADRKIAPNRVVLCGESLGGGPAVELATRHEHRALVLVFTFTSLPAAAKSHYPFLPTHTFMRTRFDNLAKIGRCPRPVFLVHGTDDRTVPFDHSERLFAAANEPKQFLRLEGKGHDLFIVGLYAPELAKFLDRRAP